MLKYNVNVTIVKADLSTDKGVDDLMESIVGKKIGCFVNSSGITHKIPGDLVDLKEEENNNIISLHVTHATQLIQRVNRIFKQ